MVNERGGGNGLKRILPKDTVTEVVVRSYFKEQEERDGKAEEIIDVLLKEKKELIIWGTGSYVMSLLSNTNLSKCRIQGFVDNNKIKQGRKMYEMPVYSPEYLRNKKYTVLICSMLYGEQIQKQLEAMHTENEIIVL